MLAEVSMFDASAVRSALDSAALVDEGCAAAAVTFEAPTELDGADDAASTVVEPVESAPLLPGADADGSACSISVSTEPESVSAGSSSLVAGAGASGIGGAGVPGVAAVLGSLVSVWAPPLLLTVTPGVTSSVRDVDPLDGEVPEVVDVDVLPEAVDSDTVDDGGVDAESEVAVPAVSAVSVSAVSVSAASEASEASPAALDEDSDESAHAVPGEVITAIPIPNAAASAPTRPM